MSIVFTPSRQFRMWVVITTCALVSLLGIIPGLGLPGMIFMSPGLYLIELLKGSLPGDAIWGLAIYMTMSLFPFFVAAYVLAFRLLVSKSKRVQWLTWFAMCLVWSLLGTTIFSWGVDTTEYDLGSQLEQILENQQM